MGRVVKVFHWATFLTFSNFSPPSPTHAQRRYLTGNLAMQSILSGLFDDAENRYLPPETLTKLNQYVKSLPLRIATYRALRDHEVKIMQVVANRLETEFAANHGVETVEQSLRHGLLILRHCAMALLMDDAEYLERQLLGWLRESMQIHQTAPIDMALWRYLRQVLHKAMSAPQFGLLDPMIVGVQKALTVAEAAALSPVR
jgi:Phycobilisome protein